VKFQATDIGGVVLIEIEPHLDERGFFARLYCPEEFAAAGIQFKSAQTSLSRNVKKHTLRGVHFQPPLQEEAKLIHVTQGALYEVVVDLRRDSPTFRRWQAFNLDARRLRAIYVPEGCGHGFLTLEPNTDVLYQISRLHVPGFARGYRWDDPLLGIEWPAVPAVVSEADRTWPNFSG
jgi:dTDP-4-dehydrorhamnose 3,5-epimerase